MTTSDVVSPTSFPVFVTVFLFGKLPFSYSLAKSYVVFVFLLDLALSSCPFFEILQDLLSELLTWLVSLGYCHTPLVVFFLLTRLIYAAGLKLVANTLPRLLFFSQY